MRVTKKTRRTYPASTHRVYIFDDACKPVFAKTVTAKKNLVNDASLLSWSSESNLCLFSGVVMRVWGLLLFGIFIVGQTAEAQNCPPLALRSFAVYVKENIEAHQSDYRGLTGAGGTTHFQGFYIRGQRGCTALTAGGDFQMSMGTVDGNVEAGQNLNLVSGEIRGSGSAGGEIYMLGATFRGSALGRWSQHSRNYTYANRGRFPGLRTNHAALAAEMDRVSATYRDLAPNSLSQSPSISELRLVATAGLPQAVFSVDASVIEMAQEIIVSADANQEVVINVKGRVLDLSFKRVRLLGGVGPRKLVWNFPEAEAVYVAHTFDAAYGWPGTLIAPNAHFEFYEGLVTGAIWARSMRYAPGMTSRSGQVNPVPEPGTNPFE